LGCNAKSNTTRIETLDATRVLETFGVVATLNPIQQGLKRYISELGDCTALWVATLNPIQQGLKLYADMALALYASLVATLNPIQQGLKQHRQQVSASTPIRLQR